MKCEMCGRGIPEGVTLHRQNEKGVRGIWRCTDCNIKPIPPEVKQIMDVLEISPKDKYVI